MEEMPPRSSASMEVLTKGECSQSNGRQKTVREKEKVQGRPGVRRKTCFPGRDAETRELRVES